MREKRKFGFALPLVLVVVAVGIIAVGAVAYFQFKPNTLLRERLTEVSLPTPSPTQATSPTKIDETANWKTYTSKNLGISFRYPVDWIAEGNESPDAFIIKSGDYKDTTIGVMGTKILAGMQLTINPLSVTASGNIDKDFQKSVTSLPKESEVSDVRKINLSGGSAYRYSNRKPNDVAEEVIFFEVNSKPLIVSLACKSSEAKMSEQTFNQILSTFRFE